ncbi:hypothetical protein HMPREF9466_01033 [Fusobacterium necrophorum subsp. funduliforme 1_1_36S]|nr:hypothetical protein HMPREF9466_01033 [Fusobacterium necrophorum subsp. funduliforme 1_1_36S]
MRKLFLSLWIFLLSISGFPIQSIGNTNGKDSTRQHINMTVSSREKDQKLEGMVLDEEGYAIAEVVLEAKQNGKVRTVQSDKYGKFQFSVDSGLLSIFAQKEGFLAGGEIILVREGRPIKNLQIVLKKRYSHILGIVTDGVKALSGVTVRLRNENLETIDQVFSDALGYYQFRNIGDNQKVAVSVYEEGFQEYISDFFLVDKNYEKEHIILRKKRRICYNIK